MISTFLKSIRLNFEKLIQTVLWQQKYAIIGRNATYEGEL